MAKLSNIFLCLLYLNLRVTRDHTKACARCIEKHSIKLGEHLWAFAAVLAHNHGIVDAKSVQVSIERLQSLFLHIICDKNACVLHKLGNVRCLTTWSCCHIQYSLVRLWGQSHYWQERGWTLKNVVTCQILWSSTDGH